MRLRQLIKILDNCGKYSQEREDFEVKGISCDSRKVQKNFIFVAICGNREDGHKFIKEAIERGAKAVVIQNSKFLPVRPAGKILTAHKQDPIKDGKNSKEISFLVIDDTRKALAKLAAEFYGNPSRKMKVVGVTGTNGKTTVTYLIEAILKESGFHPGVLSTINYRFKDKVILAKNTTPGPVEIQSLLSQMLKGKTNYAIMEVSSHALAQDRTEGINFHSAIFTNLTQDHLDYHKTISNYFRAKTKLFKNLNKNSFAVINGDDRYAKKIARVSKAEVLTYGIKNRAEVKAKEIKLDVCGMQFRLEALQKKIDLKTQLIGLHNIYNILASVTWALKEGLDLSLIKSAIEKFTLVPGRLEKVGFNGPFSVFVDYAHTEDALKNVIGALRQISCRRIIVVFGCGGERDRSKRPKMGYVVSELADYAIITDDNPRGENSQEIINAIKKGIKKNNYCVIPDRFQAIKKSLSLARPQDVVLVAGKGHENYQILKDKTVTFNDREAVRECLRLMNY